MMWFYSSFHSIHSQLFMVFAILKHFKSGFCMESIDLKCIVNPALVRCHHFRCFIYECLDTCLGIDPFACCTNTGIHCWFAWQCAAIEAPANNTNQSWCFCFTVESNKWATGIIVACWLKKKTRNKRFPD